MSIRTDSHIGKYLIEKKLFYNVFRAFDEKTGVSVIVKKIDRGAASPKIAQTTIREISAIQACIHPGVPMIIECFEFQEEPNGNADLCIVFKDEQGISVEDMKNIEARKIGSHSAVLTADQITKLFFELLGILDFIHQKNMAHR